MSSKFKVGDKVVWPTATMDRLKNSCNTVDRHRAQLEDGGYLILTTVPEGTYTQFAWIAYDKHGEELHTCSGHNLKDEDFMLYKKDINNISSYVAGDILVDCDDDERMVLAVCGKIVAVSCSNTFDCIDAWYTIEELKSDIDIVRFKYATQDENIEITIEEIAKLKGVDASRIRVKKEN